MTAEARKADSAADAALDGVWDELAIHETAPPPSLGGTQLEQEPSTPSTVSGRYSAGAIIAGKYQLSSVIGEGGMGSVWVAKNRTLDVEVALKLMRPELAEDVEGIAERMLQEARAAASIGHPAIIQVFDFGYSELGDPFIAMELLRGESLAQTLRRRKQLMPLRAAQTLLPIIDALAAAHARGIVHRDLKPENIFLTRLSGRRLQPKVLDFGIAKLEQRAAERITRDGAVIGSPAYMAPEQLRGAPDVDARVDVWAMCVVLYQMLLGRRPFDGENYHASLWNVVHTPPPPITENGIDEPELWDILARGLNKDPNARTRDMRTLGRELAGWLLSRGVNEDICEASLRAWFVDEQAQANAHSFFPSQAPVGHTSAALEISRPAPLGFSVETSGTRRITPPSASAGPVRPPFTNSPLSSRVSVFFRKRQWLWLTAASALLAFAGAGIWAALRPSERARAAAEMRSAPRVRLLETIPSAKRGKVPPIAEDGAPPQKPAAAAPEVSVPEPVEPPAWTPNERVRSRAPAPKIVHSAKPPPKRASKSDLKNPFE